MPVTIAVRESGWSLAPALLHAVRVEASTAVWSIADIRFKLLWIQGAYYCIRYTSCVTIKARVAEMETKPSDLLPRALLPLAKLLYHFYYAGVLVKGGGQMLSMLSFCPHHHLFWCASMS